MLNSLSLKADTVIDLSEQGQYHQGQGDTTSSFFDSDTAPELGKNPELGKTRYIIYIHVCSIAMRVRNPVIAPLLGCLVNTHTYCSNKIPLNANMKGFVY